MTQWSQSPPHEVTKLSGAELILSNVSGNVENHRAVFHAKSVVQLLKSFNESLSCSTGGEILYLSSAGLNLGETKSQATLDMNSFFETPQSVVTEKKVVESVVIEFYESVLNKSEDDYSWLDSLYEIDMDSTSPSDVRFLFRKIGEYFRDGRFGACDNVLKRIDVERAPTLVLVSLIRRTYPAHSKLKEWTNTLASIYKELNARDYNANEMLRGLLAFK